jgi:hypothetical protein
MVPNQVTKDYAVATRSKDARDETCNKNWNVNPKICIYQENWPEIGR